MASTLELLDAIDAQAEENVCIVDAVNRTISVPESLRLLGVESDEKAEVRRFRCPKIVGNNIDLTALILFINFENAGGQKGAYRIKDVQEEGDGTNITFSWELERKVTAYQGSPKFSLCAQRVKSGDDGTLEQEWNTTFNEECEVLEGLEVQESIEEEETAALTQIWQKINELEFAVSGGGSGTPGKDGREIEIQNNGTAIQWRYVGDDDWTDLVQLSELKGDPGDDGITPNIQIGTVQTLEPEQQATASVTGTTENPLLNLGIPKGGQGPAGDSGIVSRQEMQNTDTVVTLQPNILYVFPEMSSLTVTLAEPDNSNVANEYHFFFTSGATATTLTLNDVLSDAYSVDANMKYEVSILENVAYIKGVSTGAA